jgi:hypothetical protein
LFVSSRNERGTGEVGEQLAPTGTTPWDLIASAAAAASTSTPPGSTHHTG